MVGAPVLAGPPLTAEPVRPSKRIDHGRSIAEVRKAADGSMMMHDDEIFFRVHPFQRYAARYYK